MKKNIIIAAVSILLLVFVVYSFIKANDAYKYKEMARLAQYEAERNAEEALRQSELARSLFEKAKAAQEKTEKALEDCQSK